MRNTASPPPVVPDQPPVPPSPTRRTPSPPPRPKKKSKAPPPPPADKKKKKKARRNSPSSAEEDDDLAEDGEEDDRGREDPVIIDLTGDVRVFSPLHPVCILSTNFQYWGEPIINNLEVAKVNISFLLCLYSHSQLPQLSPEEVPLHLFHPVEGKEPMDYVFRAPSSVVGFILIDNALY
jgi:hypothetical protein